VKFAEESPEPPLEELYDYTFVEAGRPRPGQEENAEQPESKPAPSKSEARS
jgi:hypothetical protein